VRDRHHRHGIPIEEAPWWALLFFTALLWLIAFPALAGLLAGWGAWSGQRLPVALAALALAVLMVLAVTRRPWRRPRGPTLEDPRPPLVRFSTWLYTALLLPNLLFGILVLTRDPADGPPLTYETALVLGLLVSAIHGAFALAERLRARWRRRGADRDAAAVGAPRTPRSR
jgi:hypothetical protein